MAWQQGPLPPDTWGWGGVVPKGVRGSGFYFADFQGDKVELVGDPHNRCLSPDQVAFFDNSIELPPNSRSGYGDPKPEAPKSEE
jgi:hypothetical protein